MRFFHRFLIAMVCLCAIGCGGSGSYKNVEGTIAVKLDDGILACSKITSLPRGYSDIPSTQIVVRDVNEEFLIEMEPSPFNGWESSCIGDTWYNYFYGEDLPKHDKYIIDAGRRGEIFVDAEDFEVDDDGAVEIFSFTIG